MPIPSIATKAREYYVIYALLIRMSPNDSKRSRVCSLEKALRCEIFEMGGKIIPPAKNSITKPFPMVLFDSFPVVSYELTEIEAPSNIEIQLLIDKLLDKIS